MQDIERFIDGGFTTGDIRWEPYLEKRIMEYIETNTILRQYCMIYPLAQNTWTVKIPRDYPTGMAVEISEGSEIPRVKQTADSFELSVIKYGTGGEMTDESKETDWLGILGQKQIDEAGRRMFRKLNNDIATVMQTGYGIHIVSAEVGKVKYEDFVALKTEMIKRDMNPTVVLCAPDRYADLQVDQMFVDASRSGSDQTLREGVVGRISGMDIVVVPELPAGLLLMMDPALDPVWLVERQGVRIARDRDEERQIDSFYMTAWAKPAVVRPTALGAIVLKTE